MTYKVQVLHQLKHVEVVRKEDVTLQLNDGQLIVNIETIRSQLMKDIFPIDTLTLCSCMRVIQLPDFSVTTATKMVELLQTGETLLTRRQDLADISKLKRALGCVSINVCRKVEIPRDTCPVCFR